MAASAIGNVEPVLATNDDSAGRGATTTTEISPPASDDLISTVLNESQGEPKSSSDPAAQHSTLSDADRPSSIETASGNDKQIFGATSENLVQLENHPNNVSKTTLDSSLSHQDSQTLAQPPASPNYIPTLNSHPTPHIHRVLTDTSPEHLFHPKPSFPPPPTTDIGITRPFTASPLISPHDGVHYQDPNPSHDPPRRLNSMNSRDDKAIAAKELSSRKSDTILVERLNDPGLFTPRSSPLRPHFRADSPESFPTHDLNDWHKPIPKETHSADIDVDPVSGRKIINEYEIVGELGRGVHGKVKLGRNLQTGTNVAIKIIERVSKRRRLGRTGNQEEKIKKEIAILKKARHKNIVGLLEVIDDPAMKKVYIVLEHVELGEVKWRTHGEDEICLIEYRRHLREAQGIIESDAAEHEDHLILENARRNLERREIEDRDQLHRDVGPWSLEHGDSDPDVNFFSTKEEPSEIPHPNDPPSKTSTADNPTSATPLDPHHEDTKRHSDTLKTSDYHTAIESHTPLGGTMYGAYENDEMNDPVHESYESSVDHYGMDRIPEHFRQVPVMTLNEARKAIRDTVLGLEYLHYQGVIHRDIKPANLLMTKNRDIKISDFGVSYLGKQAAELGVDDKPNDEVKDYDEALELAKTVGTPAFYAPELCRTDIDYNDPPPVGKQIDVWAVGVTLYCFVFGRVPFHDHNTFVLMRNIAVQELHIPRQRLKAVEDGDDGLEMPSPFSPLSPTSPSPEHSCNKRYSHDLEYEEVSDELRDLLKRLLTKDPRDRIKLAEVKHHPWLLDDIKNPSRWIDENDPSKFTHGKKIEVSTEDVEFAVRLNVVDNIRKLTRRVIGGVMGLGKSHSRTRAKSTTTVPDSQASSAASSSTNMSQDARNQERRRPSLRPDELIFSAIKAYRESDHPLSHSVTASPKFEEPRITWSNPPHLGPGGRPVETLERGMSATGSIRTIRPGDLQALGSGSYTTSALPSTPLPLDTPATPLGGIFGGVKNLLRHGSTSSSNMSRNRSRSTSRRALVDEDPHGEPSLAISNTMAAGLVNLPAALQNMVASPASMEPSPGSSRPPSAMGHPDYPRSRETTETGLSRASSLSSVASRGRSDTVLSLQKAPGLPQVEELTQEALDSRPMSQSSLREREGTAEEVSKAKEEQFRRLIRESAQTRKQSLSEQQEPPAELEEECPPSPDDYIFQRHQSNASNFEHPPLTTPHNYYQRPGHAQAIAAGSSEGHLTSEMSQSTSNRSLPSAYSASSSYGYGVDHAFSSESTAKYSSTGEFQGMSYPSETDILYEESNNLEPVDDGEDSDESFIEMSRPKRSTSGPATRNASVVSSKLTKNTPQEDVIP